MRFAQPQRSGGGPGGVCASPNNGAWRSGCGVSTSGAALLRPPRPSCSALKRGAYDCQKPCGQRVEDLRPSLGRGCGLSGGAAVGGPSMGKFGPRAMWGCRSAGRRPELTNFARAPRCESFRHGPRPELGPELAGFQAQPSRTQPPKRARIPAQKDAGIRPRRTESGPKNEPGFRAQNWDRDLGAHILKQLSGPDSGLVFAPGFRARKRAQIPATN